MEDTCTRVHEETMKRKKLFTLVLRVAGICGMAVCFAGCGIFSEPTVTVPTEAETSAPARTESFAVTEAETQEVTYIDSLLAGMTLREKVGQLFIIRPDSLSTELTQEQITDASGYGVTEMTEALRESLNQYPVGGIAMFGKNIVSPEQLTGFLGDLQNASAIPLFLSVDEEGGTVARLANHSAFDLPRYPSATEVASSGGEAAALEMGVTIGNYLKQYGFNMDFAPVADVNTNPDNPVIGKRAFSSDPETAADMAEAMASGLRQAGIIPTFKHFPGHGDTATDSHTGVAVSEKSWEEMLFCEWIPFLRAGVWDCVMVGHITAPNVTGDSLPASLSSRMVTEILRGELGFSGLIITDSLEMKAVSQDYTPAEASVMALQAGCDLLLMPNGFREAFEGVVTAVESGEISQTRIDSSVKRILELKEAYGLLEK